MGNLFSRFLANVAAGPDGPDTDGQRVVEYQARRILRDLREKQEQARLRKPPGPDFPRPLDFRYLLDSCNLFQHSPISEEEFRTIWQVVEPQSVRTFNASVDKVCREIAMEYNSWKDPEEAMGRPSLLQKRGLLPPAPSPPEQSETLSTGSQAEHALVTRTEASVSLPVVTKSTRPAKRKRAVKDTGAAGALDSPGQTALQQQTETGPSVEAARATRRRGRARKSATGVTRAPSVQRKNVKRARE